MAYTLSNKCAKNLSKRTVLLRLIIKNLVTCFFLEHSVVVHLYSSFSMDPLDFFLGVNLYQKLLFLAILAAVRPHFKATMVKVRTTVGTWEILTTPNFVKIA